MDLDAELRSLGVPDDEAAQLAALVQQPPLGTLDDSDRPPDSPATLAIQAALLAARQTSRFAAALRALVAFLEQATLSPFDEGRFWHIRALVAWRLESVPFQATRALNRSVHLLSRGEEPRMQRYLARVHDTLGQILHHQGMTLDALRELERSLALRDPSDRFGAAITHGNLGRLYSELGDYAAAARELASDLAIVDELAPELRALRAQLMSHLAECHLHMGVIDRAEQLYTDSVALAAACADVVATTFGRLGLGRIALARADAPRALAVATEILSLIETAALAPELVAVLRANAHLLAADTHLQARRHDESIEQFQHALQQLANVRAASPMDYARAHRGLAAALASKQQHAEAARNLRFALRHLDGTAAETSRLEVERELKATSRDSWLLHAAGRFLGQQQIELVLGEAGRVGFRGERQRVAVLFSDIRGFTTLAERMEPEQLVGLLNDFLGHMTRCIDSHGGSVDKFIGDAVMAVFPLDADGQSGALAAAVAMQDELERFNRYLPDGLAALAIGIGIHGGFVVSGLIGSAQKRELTVIGDVVNTASRLESLTKRLGAGIIVSGDVIGARDRERYLLRPLGRFAPRGRRSSLELFEVMGPRDRTQMSRALDDEIAKMQAALTAFTSGAFDEASRELAELARQTSAPRVRGYELLLAMARDFAASPPPPSWRGEIVLGD